MTHPLAALIYCIALFFIFITLSHPLYLFGLGSILIFHIYLLKAQSSLHNYVRIGIPIASVFITINVLICQEGQTIIWQGMDIPLVNIRLDLSLEELLYNLNMAMQIVLLFSCFCLYGALQNPDHALSFFSRLTPRSSVAMVLISLLIPQLRERLLAAESMLASRGARLNEGNIIAKLRSRIPILKIALLSALEGSWQTAEALEARAYGVGRKSSFDQLRWRVPDLMVTAMSVALWIWIVRSWITGIGRYTFYPALDSVSNTFHPFSFSMLMLIVMLVTLMSLLCKESNRVTL